MARAALQYDQWHGKYKDGWKGHITSSSFSHPAKFSKGLIFHIIQHAIDEGWVRQGDTVIDPFGGVGLGGLPCALRGIHHISVELEPRFVALANGAECGGDLAKHEACSETGEHGPHHLLGNLELWQRKYVVLPQWKQPILLQGDSRHLCQIIQQHADLLVSSSPYSQNTHVNNNPQDMTAGRAEWGNGTDSAKRVKQDYAEYATPSNLGNLPTGTIDTVLSSPPYADGCTHTGGADPQPQHVQGGPLRWVAYGADQAIGSPPHCHGLSKEHTYADDAKRHKDSQRGIFTEKGIADPYYGKDKAQLGNMPLGDVAAVVQDGADCTIASPPYAQSLSDATSRIDWSKKQGAPSGPHTPGKDGMPANYSASVSNLGNLPPGDVAAVVQGDIDRKNKEIGENCLASHQNPDRMLCSVHNKLSGDSVWQSVKTAEQLYHTDVAGACPALASTDASLPLPVLSVEDNSAVDDTPSARSVTPRNNVRPSKGKRIRLNIEKNSGKQAQEEPTQLPPKQNSALPIDGLQNKQQPIQTTGAELHSAPYAKLSSSETTTPVSSVARQGEVSLSTTSEMQATPTESGITVQKTCNPSVTPAISKHMQAPRAHAWSVEPSLLEPTSEELSVHHNADNKGAPANSKNARPQDTFWSASKTILQQVFDTLKPGGHAIWVCKHYIRDGKLVDFPGDWQRLATHVGFQTVHIHLAMLVERRVETHLFEGTTTYEQWTESFFRRLSRKKSGIGVEFETIICQVKPRTAAPMPPDEAWQQLPLVADCSITSAPFADMQANPVTGMDPTRHHSKPYGPHSMINSLGYGTTQGNLGRMAEGTLDCALASPPYASTPIAACEGNMGGGPGGREASALTTVSGNRKAVGYSTNPHNLGNLPEGQRPE